MSVLDRFLNIMKLNDDELEEEDYLDEEENDFEEERPKRRVIRERDEDDTLFDDRSSESSVSSSAPAEDSITVSSRSKGSVSGKISPLRSRNKRSDASSMAVCVIRPHSMEDAREITETLLSGCAVVLNVEGLELELAQRIIDFASGSCFAIDGNLQKISSYIFIITPSSVDISGDFQDLISGAFDVPIDGHRF